MGQTMTNRQAYEAIKKRLADAGIENAAFEARQIFYHASGHDAAWMLAHYSEDAGTAYFARLFKFCMDRLEGVPLQYILGKWSFHSVELLVREGVLIPRSDSEVLADCAIEYLEKSENKRVLDLCSGSGCIAFAIKDNVKAAEVTALDKFPEPLKLIKDNIEFTGLDINVTEGDVLKGEGGEGTYSLITCNPPYIRSGDMPNLQKEVQFEPKEALDGGEDGLIFYRALAEHWLDKLEDGGMLAAEIGFDEAKEVAEIFSSAGLRNIKILPDTNGLDRVVCGIK